MFCALPPPIPVICPLDSRVSVRQRIVTKPVTVIVLLIVRSPYTYVPGPSDVAELRIVPPEGSGVDVGTIGDTVLD